MNTRPHLIQQGRRIVSSFLEQRYQDRTIDIIQTKRQDLSKPNFGRNIDVVRAMSLGKATFTASSSSVLLGESRDVWTPGNFRAFGTVGLPNAAAAISANTKFAARGLTSDGSQSEVAAPPSRDAPDWGNPMRIRSIFETTGDFTGGGILAQDTDWSPFGNILFIDAALAAGKDVQLTYANRSILTLLKERPELFWDMKANRPTVFGVEMNMIGYCGLAQVDLGPDAPGLFMGQAPSLDTGNIVQEGIDAYRYAADKGRKASSIVRHGI